MGQITNLLFGGANTITYNLIYFIPYFKNHNLINLILYLNNHLHYVNQYTMNHLKLYKQFSWIHLGIAQSFFRYNRASMCLFVIYFWNLTLWIIWNSRYVCCKHTKLVLTLPTHLTYFCKYRQELSFISNLHCVIRINPAHIKFHILL